MKVFILSGKAQSGKDEFYRQQDLPNSIRLAYGDFVKTIAKELGWDGNKDEKGRQFLQFLGDGVRNFYKNHWTDKMINKINNTQNNIFGFYDIPDYIFVTDVRYPNEISEVEKVFDVVKIRIERPNNDNGLTLEQQRHISECALDNYEHWDYVVINDGTLKDYREKIGRVLDESKDN